MSGIVSEWECERVGLLVSENVSEWEAAIQQTSNQAAKQQTSNQAAEQQKSNQAAEQQKSNQAAKQQIKRIHRENRLASLIQTPRALIVSKFLLNLIIKKKVL